MHLCPVLFAFSPCLEALGGPQKQAEINPERLFARIWHLIDNTRKFFIIFLLFLSDLTVGTVLGEQFAISHCSVSLPGHC